jgi:hypothetical protein
MARLVIVKWYEWVLEGVGGGLVLLVVGAIGTRFVNRRDVPSLGPTITTGEPSSNVHVGGDGRGGLSVRGISDADRKSIANYLLEQLRSEGLLPAPGEERTPAADTRLAHQEKEAEFLLAKAINTLPEREKVIMTLQFVEGLSVGEMAQVLAVSSSTVYRVRRSALKRLADLVGPTFEMP